MITHRVPVRRGFTLIELLVVIAIIALLVSLLMPSLKQAKEWARAALCLSNARLIGVSIPQYLNDNDDHLPRYADPIYPSDYAAEGVDPSEYDGSDGPLRKVLRYALITTWQGDIYDPVRNGDGFFAPYLNNSDNNKVNLLGCPSVPDRRERKIYTHNWREYNYHIERGKSYCLNYREVTRIVRQGNNEVSLPLPISKVPRPAELVYMAEGPARAVHFHLRGENSWAGWTADIPTERHFGEFNMAFVDGHADHRPMIGTYPDPYFRRE
jgi:prepilin-type N-terminal cleavage/methylation domain-containing protein/prepilin-type processing-associated H-X9-DG protein